MMDAHSEAHLIGVEPRLIACVRLAATTCKQPFRVIQGLRTAAEQQALFLQGRNGHPGPIVTWKDGVVHKSNHQALPDGFGHAVDLAALESDGSIDWVSTSDYDTIKGAMFEAAKAIGVKLRWGADWNRNGIAREHGETDLDHFELFEPVSISYDV